MDVVAEHLLRVAKDEGVTLAEPAAQAMARQSEGSFRDALSLLDQASVLGGGTIDEDVVTSLIGTGRQDVQYSLADAVAVGDAKGVFELVSRLVQEGQDLRFVTNEVLTHFRNLLVVRTAPGQADLLDVTDDEVERLNAQAAKFSAPELARVISLLLAAQTDMRWTTSPRLSLELALVRSTIPEADERPEALLSRVERLERIAGIVAAGGRLRGAGARLRFRGAIPVGGRFGAGERRSTVAFCRHPCAEDRGQAARSRRQRVGGGRGWGGGRLCAAGGAATSERSSERRSESALGGPETRPRPRPPRPPSWEPGRRRWTCRCCGRTGRR